jgi:hypothetical protein
MKAQITVLCIYKNYRINSQHKSLCHKALCKEPIEEKYLNFDPNPSHYRTVPSLCSAALYPEMWVYRKVLLAPVIAFQKTKNSFKNICQELKLNDIFLFMLSAQFKMALNVIKPLLIQYLSMHEFKVISKLMNKHWEIQTIKQCRMWNHSPVIMLQFHSLRKYKTENIGTSYYKIQIEVSFNIS